MSDTTPEMIALAGELLVLSWGADAVSSLSDQALDHHSKMIAQQYSSEAELRATLKERRSQPQFNFRQATMESSRTNALDEAARAQLGDGYVDALMAYLEEYRRASYSGVKPRESPDARKLLDAPPAQRMALLLYVFERLVTFPRYGLGVTMGYAMGDLVRELAKSAPRPTQKDVAGLLDIMAAPGREEWNVYSPDPAILTLCEKAARAEAFTPETRADVFICLDRFDARIKVQNKGEGMTRDEQKFRARLWALGLDNDLGFRMADTLWGALIERDLAATRSDLEPPLRKLLQFASKGSGAAPSAKWVKDASALLANCDDVATVQALVGWVEALHPEALAARMPAPNGARDPRAFERAAWGLPTYHQEQARRMLWLAALADPVYTAAPLEKLAIRANAARHPEYGWPMSVIFGGAISALAMIDKAVSAPALLRLRRKMKSVGDQKTIDKALASLAAAAGVSVTTLEEASVPDFGFGANGEIEMPVGGGKARIKLDAGTAATLQWIGADGKVRRSPPRAESEEEKAPIAAARILAKEIGETLKSHAARLERLYLADHCWAYADWRRSFRDQPVLRHLADALIWAFEQSSGVTLALPSAERLTDELGRAVTVADDAVVQLWHPIGAPLEIVQAWRRRILSLQITQPVKQAYREVYLLTEAERATGDYSNRFAAHIIRQSQFRALAKAREWRAPLSGYWDGPEHPRRILPAHGLAAEFVTTGVDAPAGESPDGAYGAFGLLSTDRVRFTDAQVDYVALDRVPPVVFSEIMRDVDLFVGVASIGADAQWSDQGANRRFMEYWTERAFGELTGSAETRRQLIADLLPALSIADRCELTDRALVVTGKFNRYRIHLGSGNILMEPGSRYLCIVPSGAGAANVRLPFEGDAVLSIILSKAFLLAEDDKIKDRSIVGQLKRLA